MLNESHYAPTDLFDDLPLLECDAPLALARLGQVVGRDVLLRPRHRGAVHDIELHAGAEVEGELYPGALLHVVGQWYVGQTISIQVFSNGVCSREPTIHQH